MRELIGSGRGTRSPDLTIRGFTTEAPFAQLIADGVSLAGGQLLAAAWSKALFDLLAEEVGQ